MLNKKTDIIRNNNRDYLNVTSENSLIKKLVATSAENAYGFNVLFGQFFDQGKVEEMKGTYWLRVPNSDDTIYNDDVNLETITY